MSPPSVSVTGIATTYYKGDGFTPGKYFGCWEEAKRLLGTPKFRDDLPTVAMRSEHAKCGSVVRITHLKSGNRTLALVVDRGPFGCRWKNGSRSVEPSGGCIPQGGKRIALIDLSPVIAKELGSSGFDKVTVSW